MPILRPARSNRALRLLAFLCLGALCVSSAEARAEQLGNSASAQTRAVAFDLAASTRVPLSVGPELSLELPGRVLLQGHLGWMPGLYSRAVSGALRDGGLYGAAVQALIDDTLQSVTTSSLSAGWRPFPGAGLELFAGYTHISLSGATRSGAVISVLSRDVAQELRTELGEEADLRLASSLHAMRAGLGWRWLIARHIVVRASIEYMKAFASSSRLESDSFPNLTNLAAPVAQQLLNQHYVRYVSLPLFGLSLGVRL